MCLLIWRCKVQHMTNRRLFFTSVGATILVGSTSAVFGQVSTFDSLLEWVRNSDDERESAAALREGLSAYYEDAVGKAIALRTSPSTIPISQSAVDLIVAFEVGSKEAYNRKYQKPVLPGGNSGITIGIGYDLGYCMPEWLQADWDGLLMPLEIAVLSTLLGVKGDQARPKLAEAQKVVVPWQLAEEQFQKRAVPNWIAETLEKLPREASRLSPEALGALVSLTYNRGASYRASGDRYLEMRRIYSHIESQALEKIPSEIRAMKRLWVGNPSLRGLLIRRDAEALLFERGLR
jgi:GH24 family phage-related lysozyme (muramidase)